MAVVVAVVVVVVAVVLVPPVTLDAVVVVVVVVIDEDVVDGDVVPVAIDGAFFLSFSVCNEPTTFVPLTFKQDDTNALSEL